MADYARGINRRWWRQFGRSLHDPTECEGRPCPVHHPTHHRMWRWPRLWRWDRGLLERVCEHGVGHPDPDHLASVRARFGEAAAEVEGGHGCDGCCHE